MPNVNPEILRWARETAGFTLEEAAEKLKLSPLKGASAVHRLAALETGVLEPSRPMLVKMAKQYHRPLLTFYLSGPPKRGDRGKDFRTLPEGYSPSEDALLDVLIRDVRARQSMVRTVLEDEDEAVPLSYIGSNKVSDGIRSVLASIRRVLNIDLSEFRSKSSVEEAFGYLRDRAEEGGVFVLLKGDLGSHHTAIDVQTFRGFALADPVAPFVVINDQDSKSAWSFTLIHELTHLWLGQTGVSNMQSDIAVERFCNDVASEFLLPNEEIRSFPIDVGVGLKTLESEIGSYANERNLSASMVAYNLLRVESIDRETWVSLNKAFRQRWEDERRRRREQSREQEGGPSFYVVRAHRAGKALLNLVGRMLTAGTITTSKAAKVLGVKAKQVQILLETHPQGGTRRTA